MKLTTESEVGYKAIRNTVAFSEESELFCLQLTGERALDVLDAVCPCDIFLQDGQMKHTLLLDEEGIPFADVYVCREGENAYLLGYGTDAGQVSGWIKNHTSRIGDYSIINLMETYESLSLDGPYAWELCTEVLGPDILGLPYLSMLVLETVLVFRAGRTGEYGYHILIPIEEKNTWLDKIFMTGTSFDLARADASARAQCVMENFFFDFNREGRYGLTPMELQLQWRLSHKKVSYPGSGAIHKIKKTGWNRRLTCFITQTPVNIDDEITCDGETVGRILVVGYSPQREDYVGKALINQPFWHAGLEGFQVGSRPLKTISSPAINNLSMKISPYLHSFHDKEEDFT